MRFLLAIIGIIILILISFILLTSFSLFSSITSTPIFLDFTECYVGNLPELPNNAYENSTVLIPWSEEKFLSWNDFQGKEPSGDRFNACTFTWIRYQYDIDLIENSPTPEYEFTNFSVESYFRVQDSWVRDILLEDNLETKQKILKHEQGHFDIAEEHSRKMMIVFTNELLNKSFLINSNETKNLLDIAKLQASNQTKQIWNAYYNEWTVEDDLYDVKTNGGLNDDVQHEFNVRFGNLRN